MRSPLSGRIVVRANFARKQSTRKHADGKDGIVSRGIAKVYGLPGRIERTLIT
jgi:hypothetical protein